MKAREGDAQAKKRHDGPVRHSGSSDGSCPHCGARVPAKPGFRLSSLKCPSCGKPVGRK